MTIAVTIPNLIGTSYKDIPPTYAQLFSWYPIKSIRGEAEYDAAVKITGALAVYDHLNEDQER